MLKQHKTFKIIAVTLIFAMQFLLFGAQPLVQANANTHEVIVGYNEFCKAVSNAQSGDVIYVGDIDFTPLSKDEFVTNKKIIIDKSLTIIGDNLGEPAYFKNGMFEICGSKVTGEKVVVSFIDIIFDGTIDTENLALDTLPNDGYYSHAVDFLGNVDCSFSHCQFKNYYNVEGGAFEIRYGDYTNDAYKRDLYPDQSGCKLNLNFSGCEIANNRAFYTGGAFVIESNNNVNLKMTNCNVFGNKSGAYYGMGGGAFYCVGASLTFLDSSVKNNQCNYCYPQTETYYPMDSLSDNARGGGLYLKDCALEMIDCVIAKNVGTMGGGLALTNTVAVMDGCTLAQNSAERCKTLASDETICMPCSLGQGGAMYVDGDAHKTVTLNNCYVCENVADIAYGGIYQFYNGPTPDPIVAGYLKLNCCTYANNAVSTKYNYEDSAKAVWIDLPGDVWTNPSTTLFGCLMVDETFGVPFAKNQKPTEQNGYNYFASGAQAETDGVSITYAPNEYIPKVQLVGEEWSIPSQALQQVFGDRYNGKLTSAVVGSNYKKELYYDDLTIVMPNHGDNNAVVWVWIASALGAVVVCGCVLWLFARKTKLARAKINGVAVTDDVAETDEELTETLPEQNSVPKYVVVRYSEEQVAGVMSTMPEVQLLTDRECEVLRQMLLGKRQTEIAKSLFVSTSTIKDFYRKIYNKMGVDSKDELFSKVFEENKN